MWVFYILSTGRGAGGGGYFRCETWIAEGDFQGEREGEGLEVMSSTQLARVCSVF